MKKSRAKPLPVGILVFLQIFLSIGALASGAMLMIKPDGSLMSMPLSMMKGSPFSSFFLPGLILFTFLGVFPAIIAYGLMNRTAWRGLEIFNPFKKYNWSWAGSLVTGIIVFIWLSVELIWVGYSFLHTVYFIWGILNTIITLTSQVRGYLVKNHKAS